MQRSTVTMKATNLDAGGEEIMSIGGHASLANLSHHSPTSGWRRSGAPSTRSQRPGLSRQEAQGGSGTARTAAACAAGGVHALQEPAAGLASRYGFAGAVTGSSGRSLAASPAPETPIKEIGRAHV